MKKVILSLLILAFTGLASAQEATLNTPVAKPSEAKFVVSRIYIDEQRCEVEIAVKDSSNNTLRLFNVKDQDTAAFFTALDTVRASETGGPLRRANFRVLGRLSDAGLLPVAVTLVP